MSESKVDRVSISKEAQVGRPAGIAPSWIPPVLKRFYDFTRKWAGTFSNELDENKRSEREEALIKVVSKSFKGQI
jgi:oxalate decarboxylase/phosphoglucose isomerase-like protein (cupin superfamily)